jgi:hypothetical protein
MEENGASSRMNGSDVTTSEASSLEAKDFGYFFVLFAFMIAKTFY